MFGINEGDVELSQFWKKYQTFFSIFSLLIYPYLYYILFIVLGSYWIPILIIFPIKYFVKRFVIKKLSLQYWQISGINDIREYATEKGLM